MKQSLRRWNTKLESWYKKKKASKGLTTNCQQTRSESLMELILIGSDSTTNWNQNIQK